MRFFASNVDQENAVEDHDIEKAYAEMVLPLARWYQIEYKLPYENALALAIGFYANKIH